MNRHIRNALAFALGAALASCADTVYAAQFAVPNAGGGSMVITDEPCVVEGTRYENLQRAYSFIPSGESIEGCWARTAEDEVTIIWLAPDGTQHPVTYPARAFRRLTST